MTPDSVGHLEILRYEHKKTSLQVDLTLKFLKLSQKTNDCIMMSIS